MRYIDITVCSNVHFIQGNIHSNFSSHNFLPTCSESMCPAKNMWRLLTVTVSTICINSTGNMHTPLSDYDFRLSSRIYVVATLDKLCKLIKRKREKYQRRRALKRTFHRDCIAHAHRYRQKHICSLVAIVFAWFTNLVQLMFAFSDVVLCLPLYFP